MKKVILFLILLMFLPISICRAGFLGIKKSSETIAFPVHPPLDSAGIPGPPDSIQVITYADNDISAAYSATAAGYTLAQIDTTREFGGTHLWFVDQIQDLDGGGGNVELAIQVITWYKKLPTYTFASLQVISDSLNMFSTFDPASDFVTADMIKISGDATAADNLETMLDGSGGNTLDLASLHIRTTTADDTALVLQGGAGSTGMGLSITGDVTAASIISSGDRGLVITGDTAFLLIGTDIGLHVMGMVDRDVSGDLVSPASAALVSDSVWSSTKDATLKSLVISNSDGDALRCVSTGNSGDGAQFVGIGTGSGLRLTAGVGGHGLYSVGGATSGHGILAEAGVGSAKDGIHAQGDGVGEGLTVIGGTNGNGFQAQGGVASGDAIYALGTGTGSGINAVSGGGATGDGIKATAASINGNGIKLTATGTGVEITGDDLVDLIWNEDSTGHYTDPHMAYLASQTGASAGLSDADMAAIADSVWDESKANHNLSGSFGDYLDASISAVGIGNGAYSISLTIFDSANSQVVPNAKLSVYNIALDAILAVGTSNSSGLEAFNLDTGSYIISANAPGYIFPAFDTLLVSGVSADTLSGYRFDPGTPASGDQCRVYGFIYGVDGQAIEGIGVSAQLIGAMVRRGSTIVSPYKYSTETDSAGYFYLDLIPSTDLNPSGTKYLITATYPAGTVLKKRVEVPDNSSWQLSW